MHNFIDKWQTKNYDNIEIQNLFIQEPQWEKV